jgi:hypothetical protein
MMKRIMPHGYSIEPTRRRMTAELRKARAGDLATASETDRARIEEEIQREVRQKLEMMFPNRYSLRRVLW